MPTSFNGLYAVNQDGAIKWNYGGDVETSHVIGDDGTIYFCVDSGQCIKAIYPNGTLKWEYTTGHVVQSSPAIGQDGTVYCGSHDNYLYALYPNNGTLKWKFKTDAWVHGSPSIGTDGAVYIGSDDENLYALYPNNGTMKWKCGVGSMRCSPSIDKNGVLYFGVWQGKFYAVYPTGTIKWSFYLGEKSGIWGSTAAISDDGTIYFGTVEGGRIYAVNPDGTEKWRKSIGGDVLSAPAVGEDGTVYIGSQLLNEGYLHAFGSLDPDAPDPPTIKGQTNGEVGTKYEYTFTTIDPNGDDVFYYINWGDGTSDGWLGPHGSGDDAKVNHTWSKKGTYMIQAQAKDTNNLKSDWGTLTVIMPRNKALVNSLFLKLLERFPLLSRLLNLTLSD